MAIIPKSAQRIYHTRPGPQPHNQIGTLSECLVLREAGLTHHPVPRELDKDQLARLVVTIDRYREFILAALGTDWIQAEIDRVVKEDLIPLIETIVRDRIRSRRAAR